jgi:methylmalonyl-CoA/ethylmalonyl-CoA epimerase
MILHVDHIGLVARSLQEASDLFIETLGFTWDLERSPMPDGYDMIRENARIYFIKVGQGETQIELLLPRDNVTGMGKWLAKHGPSVHHLAYMVDNVEEHAAELVEEGLERIDLGPRANAAFFYPRSTIGILMELVDAGTVDGLAALAQEAAQRRLRAEHHDLVEHQVHGVADDHRHTHKGASHSPGTPPHSHIPPPLADG